MPRGKPIPLLRRTPFPPFVAEDPRRALEEVVKALNEGSEYNERLDSSVHAKLLRLVRAWKASGPNLLKMKVAQEDKAQLHEMERPWQVHLSPTSSGRAYWAASPTSENYRDVAAVYFVRLIVNPLCDKLGSPCLRCDRWYVKRTMRKSVFCSRRCAGGATKAAGRAQEHELKLQMARSAIRNYRTSSRARYAKLDWKEFVSQAEPDITEKWLTRAVTLGELRPPVKK